MTTISIRLPDEILSEVDKIAKDLKFPARNISGVRSWQ